MSSEFVLGEVIFVVLLAVAAWAPLHSARRRDLLAPVLLALALRSAATLVLHLLSVSHGDQGFFYLDDIGYDRIGQVLGGQWGYLHLVNPTSVRYAGSYQVAFPVLVGFVYAFAGPHGLIAMKVVDVLLSAATVLLGALNAERILNREAGRRAAWLLAVAPSLVWWSAPMLKESLVAFLAAAVILALLSRPRGALLALAVIALGALTFTRLTVVLAIVLAALIVSVPVLVRSVRSLTLRGALTWRAAAIGAGILVLVLLVALAAATVGGAYQTTAQNMFHTYLGGNIGRLPLDMVKTWIAPYPWAFDARSRSWDRALYPGMWALYAAAPMALWGAYQLRRNARGLFVLLVIALYTLLVAGTSGVGFRQRAVAEVLLVVPLAAGLKDWRVAARGAAAALALVAAPSALDGHSLLLGAGVVSAAAAILGVSFVRFSRRTVPSPR